MTDLQRMLVTETIQEANPCPDDIEDCVNLVMEENIFSLKKVKTFWTELRLVCQLAMNAARDERPPTPPSRAVSPPSSADPVPDTMRGDAALLAAARDSRDRVRNTVG